MYSASVFRLNLLSSHVHVSWSLSTCWLTREGTFLLRPSCQKHPQLALSCPQKELYPSVAHPQLEEHVDTDLSGFEWNYVTLSDLVQVHIGRSHVARSADLVRGETHARTKSLNEDFFLADNLTVFYLIEIDVYSTVRVYLVP